MTGFTLAVGLRDQYLRVNYDQVMTSIKRRLITGGAWVLSGRLISIPATLAVNVFVARLLTPAEMGAYFLVFSLVSICTAVAQLGLQHTVVRFVAESLGTGRPERAGRTVRLVFRLGTLSALSVAALLAAGGGPWLTAMLSNGKLVADIMGLVAAWVVVAALQELLAQSFRGFHDIRLATLFGGVLTNVVSLLLFASLWLFREHTTIRLIVIMSLVAVAANLLTGFPFLRSKLKTLGKGNDLKGYQIIKNSWPIWVTSLTFIALTQANLWIIGIFRTNDEVALYGAAARLVALVALPLAIANAVVPPFIAEMYVQGKRHDLENALRSAATVAGICALAVLATFLFLGTDVLKLIYGDYYRAAVTMLILLSLGQFGHVLAGSCGAVLLMTGHQAPMMWITVTCGFLNIGGALLIVDHYGAPGVATVAAATMLVQNGMMLLFAKQKTGVWTHARLALKLPLQILRHE